MTNLPPPTQPEFNRRHIAQHQTLGQRLRQAREQERLSTAVVAQRLSIRREYIEALEASDYRHLPSKVFVKNYVRNYAKLLQLNWQAVEPMLDEEIRVYEATPDIPTLKRHLMMRPLRAVQVAAALGLVLLAVALAAYFSFEIGNIVQPPPLQIDHVPTTVPADQHTVTITGQTAPEAIVSINDQEIPVQTDGSFSQVMTVQLGSNVFKVSAKTKRSKTNTQYLQIYVETN